MIGPLVDHTSEGPYRAGDVMIIRGANAAGVPTNTVEVYDRHLGTFSSYPSILGT